jgi:hypothetical protein
MINKNRRIAVLYFSVALTFLSLANSSANANESENYSFTTVYASTIDPDKSNELDRDSISPLKNLRSKDIAARIQITQWDSADRKRALLTKNTLPVMVSVSGRGFISLQKEFQQSKALFLPTLVDGKVDIYLYSDGEPGKAKINITVLNSDQKTFRYETSKEIIFLDGSNAGFPLPVKIVVDVPDKVVIKNSTSSYLVGKARILTIQQDSTLERNGINADNISIQELRGACQNDRSGNSEKFISNNLDSYLEFKLLLSSSGICEMRIKFHGTLDYLATKVIHFSIPVHRLPEESKLSSSSSTSNINKLCTQNDLKVQLRSQKIEDITSEVRSAIKNSLSNFRVSILIKTGIIEVDRLRVEVDEFKKSAPSCENHNSNSLIIYNLKDSFVQLSQQTSQESEFKECSGCTNDVAPPEPEDFLPTAKFGISEQSKLSRITISSNLIGETLLIAAIKRIPNTNKSDYIEQSVTTDNQGSAKATLKSLVGYQIRINYKYETLFKADYNLISGKTRISNVWWIKR